MCYRPATLSSVEFNQKGNQMEQIKSFDHKQAKELQQVAQEALVAAMAPYGIKVVYKGGSFDSNTFKPRFELIASGADPEKKKFESYCNWFGLKPEHHGKEFWSHGKCYKLVGLEPNRPKFPLIAVDGAGKRFKFTVDAVKAITGEA